MTNPSSDGLKPFEGQRGAKSRDPELGTEVEAPKAQETKTETQTPTPDAAKPGDAGKGGTDDYLRLRQHIARLEKQMQDMSPYAQFGMSVAQDQKHGRQAVERWQKGQPLFVDAEEGDSEGGGNGQPRPSSLTRSDIESVLNEREAAKRQMDEIMELAEENLPHFKKIRRSQKFAKALNGALSTVWNDESWFEDAPDAVKGIDDDGFARNYTAVSQAYQYLLANSPKVIEAAKAAGKAEAKEKAEKAMAAPVSSGGTSSSEEEPPEKSSEVQMIERMMKAHGRGKSFSTVARKR